jgi:hypothetical protein
LKYCTQHRGLIIYLQYQSVCPSSGFCSPAPFPPSQCVTHTPWNQSRGGQHSLVDEGLGGANSDDRKEILALCILCGTQGSILLTVTSSLQSIAGDNVVSDIFEFQFALLFALCRDLNRLLLYNHRGDGIYCRYLRYASEMLRSKDFFSNYSHPESNTLSSVTFFPLY